VTVGKVSQSLTLLLIFYLPLQRNRKIGEVKMLKKMITVLLICLVMNLTTNVAFAGISKEEKAAKKIAKIKADVTSLGTGTDAKIEVKLHDKLKLKGYITEVKTDSFVLMNEETGTTSEVPYPNVKQVKGNNLSTGVKIAIGVGILVAVVVIVCAVSKSGCEN
jgi:hypothetical protein